jgi:microcystin-dependent protein
VFYQLPGANVQQLFRGTDFDITGTLGPDGIYASGTVVMRNALTSGTVTLARHTAIQNDATFPLTGYFDRLALNAELDRLTLILQDYRRYAMGSLRVGETEQWDNPNLILPPMSGSPNSALMFDSLGAPFFGQVTPSGTLASSAFGRQVLQAASASALMTLMGFSAYFQTLVGAPDAATLRSLINAGAAAPDPYSFVPIGTIVLWTSAGTTPPVGTMFCNGAAISRTTYSALFALIGVTFGSGDGSTTFNIPDLRGRVPAGRDDMGGSAAGRMNATGGVTGTAVGATGGAQAKVLATGELPPHSHAVPANLQSGGSLAGGTGAYISLALANDGTSGLTGSGNGFPILPPLQIVNYLMKVI